MRFPRNYRICSVDKNNIGHNFKYFNETLEPSESASALCRNISVAFHVKDRDIQLKNALETWSRYPFFKIIVLNWQKEDYSTRNLCEQYDVDYWQIMDDGWNRAVARNIKMAISPDNQYIFQADCDIVVMNDFMENITLDNTLNTVYFVGNPYLTNGKTDIIHNSCWGLSFLTKRQYFGITGCNENIINWGHEDWALYNTIKRNYKYDFLPSRWFSHQWHSDDLRVKHQPIKNLKESELDSIERGKEKYSLFQTNYKIYHAGEELMLWDIPEIAEIKAGKYQS